MTGFFVDPTTSGAAFEALVAVIREWRQAGRVTTTAGLKPALQDHLHGNFAEQELGFPTFREFVEAAAAQNYIHLEQLPTRHWIALLPGESVADVPTRTSREPAAPAKAAAPPAPPPTDNAPLDATARLRSDVWQCLVYWAPDQRRVWDGENNRGIMYPVGPDGRPAWESSPERFTEMPSADMATQIAWMREWAKTLTDETARDAVLASLDDSHRGQFRVELNRLGLLPAWRAELQSRVLNLAVSWARRNRINFRELLDTRTQVTARPAAKSETARPRADAAPPEPEDEAARLRAMLHLVIDLMSLAELASLPIKAEHLLRVRG